MYSDIRNTLCNWCLVLRRDDAAEAKKNENMAIWSWLCYRNNCVLWQFLCNFFTWKVIHSFYSFRLWSTYVKNCPFRQVWVVLCVFAYFKMLCNFCVSFYKNTLLLSDLLLPGYITNCKKMAFNVVERVILLISTTKCTGTVHTN